MNRSCFLVGILCFVVTGTQAQTFPGKPVRGILGFAPGGQIDAVARIVSHRVSETWGQPIVLENRTGASGNIAAEVVAKSAADGYTLYFATQSLTTNPVLIRAGAIDPQKQLAPVTMLATAEAVLMVHPSVPVNSVKELAHYASTRPGELNFATTAVGSPAHIGMEVLKRLGNFQMESILYKNVSQASADVVSGRVKVWMTLLTPALPLIKSGALRPIGVTGSTRLKALPNIPTIKEAGFPAFESSAWYGVFVAAGTPRDIIARLNAEFNKALLHPEVQQRLADLSVETAGSTPEQLAAYGRDELARVESLVKSGALTPN